MAIGEELIAELRRRGLTGSYFDYAGYRELRDVGTSEELDYFLACRGVRRESCDLDAVHVADDLARLDLIKAFGGESWGWMALALADYSWMFAIGCLPIWILWRIHQKNVRRRIQRDGRLRFALWKSTGVRRSVEGEY